jgi:hypothetical protein
VERIKGFSREAEPSTMKVVHPVMSKTEYAKPNHEYRIVEGDTVKQKFFDGTGIHGGTRVLKIENCRSASILRLSSQIGIERQYDNNFSWLALAPYTGKYSTINDTIEQLVVVTQLRVIA